MSYEDAFKLIMGAYLGAGLTESEYIDRYNALSAAWPQLADALERALELLEQPPQ